MQCLSPPVSLLVPPCPSPDCDSWWWCLSRAGEIPVLPLIFFSQLQTAAQWRHENTPAHSVRINWTRDYSLIVEMYIKDLQEDDFEIALKVKMGITFLVKELTEVNKLSFVVSRFRLLFLKWSWQLTFHESVSIYQHIPTSNFYLMTRQSVLPSLQDWSYNYTDKMHKVFLHGCARADQ